MKIKKVQDLQPGEKFMWADIGTRVFMSAEPGFSIYRNQLLKCISVNKGRMTVKVEYLNGQTEVLYYWANSQAVVIANESPHIDHRVRCETCSKPFGDHYGGLGTGFHCKRGTVDPGDHSQWFIPNEGDLLKYSASPDFFADLGL